MGIDSFSPDSILHSPKLYKIILGKEITKEYLQDDDIDVQQPKRKGFLRNPLKVQKIEREKIIYYSLIYLQTIITASALQIRNLFTYTQDTDRLLLEECYFA
ncbi:hypothetical protein V6N13_069150 [Hibiscus sabdariffa]|uniref:Uncharacterized protein n=1 Tax=Hibiscus sabdariffa TaxID=183260 RepID=A0ABR2QPQ1_9ROSI